MERYLHHFLLSLVYVFGFPQLWKVVGNIKLFSPLFIFQSLEAKCARENKKERTRENGAKTKHKRQHPCPPTFEQKITFPGESAFLCNQMQCKFQLFFVVYTVNTELNI